MSPLVATKLHVPHPRRGAVPRPRLLDRLDAGALSRLTLVSAPAGFGKTTLMAEWAAKIGGQESTRRPTLAWVSLDARDNEPTTFWTYVVAALQGSAGAGGSSIGEAMLSLMNGDSPPPQALATLINDLEAHGAEMVLVLDDYHLIDDGEIHDGVTYLLDHLPANVHLVIATRSDPPLPLSRLRARGELVEVRAAELRFTGDETASYLTGSMELALTDADVATLADRTEGWAAALQLAALSLHGRDDPAAAIARFAGDDRFVVDYLVDEVLDRLPADLREFLLDTSILDRLTGGLCDAVTGETNGTTALRDLERANLFLVPLDDTRQWYRYHHLFADVLRSHLRAEHPDRVGQLHLRAADWLFAHGDPVDAVQHALAADDFVRAAELMELAVPTMQRERRESELAAWVTALPADVVRARPVLAMGFVGSLAQVSAFDDVGQRLAAIEAQLCPDGTWLESPPADVVVLDDAGYRSIPARVALYRAALALAHGDLAETRTLAHESLSLVPLDDVLVRASAAALVGLASWPMGDLEGARAGYTECVAGLKQVGHVADVLGVCIALGDLLRAQGRFGDALGTYEETLHYAAAAAGNEPVRGTADMHTGIAGILLERGDLPGAADQLAQGERLGEHMGLPQNPYRRRVVAAGLKAAEGDLDTSLTLLDEADRLYNGDYSPNVRPVPATRARLRLRRGELDQAQAWARLQGLSPDDELSYLREYEHVTLARILLADHTAGGDALPLEQAVTLLERIEVAAAAGGRTETVIEVLVLLSLAHQSADDTQAALDTLRRAVELGRAEGYVRVFADEGTPMAVLLQGLSRQDQPRLTASYLKRLQAACTQDRPPAPAARSGLVEPLSERELDVLRLLASELSGPEIARELHVSLNTLRTHTRNIFRKLDVTSRRAAVRRANELALLP